MKLMLEIELLEEEQNAMSTASAYLGEVRRRFVEMDGPSLVGQARGANPGSWAVLRGWKLEA